MSKTTVLIVEDEAIVAADLAGKLGQLGYQVVGTTGEGEEAVELALRLKPRVVLMDIRLRGAMDGIEAADAIRRRHDLLVIYLTAHSDVATLERAKLSGPFGYVLKPFEERELATTIEMALFKHQSELQLREQRELLRVTLASIGDGVITCDTDARITYLNPVAETLTGWRSEDAWERPIGEVFRLINEQTRQPPEDAVALVLREGRPKLLANHTALVTRDGREIPIEDSAAPILAADGRLIGVVLVFHDVTEKRRAQEALRRSHDELESCVAERTQQLIELNETLEKRINERTAEIQAASESLRASRVAALNLMEDAVIARREAEETNAKLRLEIAERERAVQALRESELFYSQTLESIPGMVFTTRPDGYCDFQSLQWVEFTGIPMSEHLGDGWNRLLHPDDRPRAYEAWQSAVEGRAPYDLEYRVRRHDGKYEWFKVIARPIRDASGQIVKWFGVAVNIDGNKQSEEELKIARESAEAANRAKSQFLANMSHELRTPMTGVLGMLDLTLDGDLEARQRDYLETAHKSASALLHILNEILDLSSIESGKFSIVEKPFSLRKCLEDSLGIFHTEARRKGLELITSLAGDLPHTLVGDALRLRQVLVNLIGNALKFTEQGKIEVTVTSGNRTPEGKVELSFTVTDTGIGIPRDKGHLLFCSFSQVDDSNTRSYGGSGLGLAICQEIVTRMGGAIACESEQGQGSSFFFTVPFGEADTPCEADETAERPLPAAGIALEPAESRKTRLLIAEDEPVIRQLLDVMLRLSNFEPEFAEDGQKAVEMWDQGEYDLVLMDVQMPRMDGFSATRAIRVREQERGGGHTLIVAMTAHAYREDENRCFDAGMDAFISKPIDLRKSVDLINELIGQRNCEV